MSSEFDTEAADAVNGGVGGPSAKLSSVGDTITGEVVGVSFKDVTVFGSNPPRVAEFAPGVPERQLVVTLKTDLRNWAGLGKAPKDQNGADRPASEDEGLRSIYAPFKTKSSKALSTAIGRAVKDVTGDSLTPEVGGRLQVRLTELRDTGKGNPAKLYEARYAAPTPKAVPSEFDTTPAPAAAPAPSGGANPWDTTPKPAAAPAASSGFGSEPPF